MKRVLSFLLYFLSACIALVIAYIIIINKPMPRGKVGPEAEALTDSIMAAIHCEEWNRLRYVAWTYQNKRNYVWDKLYNLAELKYRNMYHEFRILLNVNTRDGIVWRDGIRLDLHAKKKYLEQAWKYWSNDAFWLNPICQLRDGDVARRHVQLKDGQSALLTTYTRGGITPGDSFLWIPDSVYMPVEWRMWAHVFPIRGLKATWERWTMTSNVKVSTLHRIGPFTIEITNLTSGRHHSELGLERDPFIDFVTE